jgi:hypothetical protein
VDGNTLILVVGGIIAIVVSGLLITRPFAQSDSVEFSWELEREVSAMQKDKEAVFTALNEIEFDYRTNKLDDEDYEKLKGRYQREAVSLLVQEKKLKGEDTEDLSAEELEQRLMDEIGADVESEVARALANESI